MAEEFGLADLETGHKNLAQKLSAHVMKREAFELKFQKEITSIATNINGKLDNLIKSLDSIQSQLFNFGKGKVVGDVGKLGPIAGGLSGPVLEEFGNRPKQYTNNILQIEEIGEGNLKLVSQEHDIDSIVLSEPLLSYEGLDNFATLSPLDIKKTDDSTSEFLGPEALKRRDGIGIPFSTKRENKCKFSQSPLKIVVPFFNSADKWGSSTTTCSEIQLGKNVGPNSSYSPKICLNESVFGRDIPMEKLTKEKIHIRFVVVCHFDSAKSTTIEHLTYKLGATDKRFIERFKKEVAKMNHKPFKYRGNFDKNEVECGPGVTIDVSLLSLELPNGLEAKVSHDDQTHEQQMICCLNKMDAIVPPYPKWSRGCIFVILLPIYSDCGGGRMSCGEKLPATIVLEKVRENNMESEHEDEHEVLVLKEVVRKVKSRGGGGGTFNTGRHHWPAMVLGTFVAPLERLKLAYIVHGEQITLFELTKSIAASQGLKGFWEGNFVTILRIPSFMAINFYVYDIYRSELLKVSGYKETTNFERIFAGAVGATGATLPYIPMDTIKTVLVAPRGEALGGIIGTCGHMMQIGEFFALYRGLVPSIISIAPSRVVLDGAYDILKSAFLHSPEGRKGLQHMQLPGNELNAFHQPERGTIMTLVRAIAGACSRGATYLFEVMRWQLQMQVLDTKMGHLLVTPLVVYDARRTFMRGNTIR